MHSRRPAYAQFLPTLGAGLAILVLTTAACGVDDASPRDPAPGELTIVQLHLDTQARGEATMVVGPDGTTVLIDAGNVYQVAEIAAGIQMRRFESIP